jgi:hypothetical protein
MRDDRPRDWARPAPLGYAASADAAHFVAAPLLAAGAVALVGVVAADTDKFRLPSVTLLVMTLATAALVASVQFGFHARAMLWSAADMAAWTGEEVSAQSLEQRRRQRGDFEQWRRRIRRAVAAYNMGVTLLAAGVALCLVPPAHLSTGSTAVRWTACGIAALATLGEFTYAVTRR